MPMTALTWASLTRTVNDIKSPNNFINRLLFSNREAVTTELIEIGIFSGGREIAPFVKKNGEALMVGGVSEKFQEVSPTNIRIKRPFHASDLAYGRRPGTTIFPTSGQQSSAIQAAVARDMTFMADKLTNTEEYLACMALQDTVTYSDADNETFSIQYPRPAGHDITAAVLWDAATESTRQLEADFRLAKKLISDDVGLQPTDVILGEEAATEFLDTIKVLGHVLLNANNVNVGAINFAANFQDSGGMYLGDFCGLRVWYYPRTVSVLGSSTPLIRDKYAEFVTASPAAENVMYFGAIADNPTLRGQLLAVERFSKSWEVPDPPVRYNLVASRPLPVPRRPGSTVSMKVVSG
jgi:hypothetical protein